MGYFRAFVGWLFRPERIDRVPAFPIVKVRDHQPTILSRKTQDLVLVGVEVDPRDRRRKPQRVAPLAVGQLTKAIFTAASKASEAAKFLARPHSSCAVRLAACVDM